MYSGEEGDSKIAEIEEEERGEVDSRGEEREEEERRETVDWKRRA